VDKQAILKRIAELGLLAVLRAPDLASARRAVDALVEAGVLGIETTYSTPDAASVIEAVKQCYGDEVLVGAGSELASVGDIRSGDFAGIREKGRRFLAAIREARADAAPRASR
jgi:2-dehydro-3-deoxyphosphogluconate aldolase/(4S)-4-hydroxy-2-oxoglutarate aldolase